MIEIAWAIAALLVALALFAVAAVRLNVRYGVLKSIEIHEGDVLVLEVRERLLSADAAAELRSHLQEEFGLRVILLEGAALRAVLSPERVEYAEAGRG